jgi:hypothetical protein
LVRRDKSGRRMSAKSSEPAASMAASAHSW